jgi:hypothetical protein
MIGGWLIHGHAIVSGDGRIADTDGRMPAALRNPADWRRFQAALDASGVVVLGRASHALTPNPRGRRRLVLSSRIEGLEQRPDALWWNPAIVPVAEALATIAPHGLAAVVGGQPVFDWFLAAGYDEFHLAHAGRVRLPGGTFLFSAMADGTAAADLLAASGLVPGPREGLDPPNGVWLRVWHRA